MTRTKLIAVALFGIAVSGCAITSASRQDTGAGEGVWYVKRPLVGNAKVFYCPPQATDCYRAEVVDSSK